MTPIVYIVFNRPDLTRQSFEYIRRVRPEVLFVVADAPRADRPAEQRLTDEARGVTEAIDWPCDVRRLYAESNMGCGQRISSGITAALAEFESVIVLEDDCIPDASFFPYCETLLEHYRDDQRVMSISGDNFQEGNARTTHSYYFSKYPHCWGWATWRRAWEHFSLEIPFWPEFRDSGGLANFCENERELQYWTWILDQVHQQQIRSWALPWTLCCWLQHGLTVLPSINLVSNIGFGSDGTHTLNPVSYAALPTHDIGQIQHPSTIFRNALADQFTDSLMYSGPWGGTKRHRKKWFSLGKRQTKRAA